MQRNFYLIISVYSLDCWSCQGKECEEKTAWKQVPGCGKTVNGKTQVGACLRQVYTGKLTFTH